MVCRPRTRSMADGLPRRSSASSRTATSAQSRRSSSMRSSACERIDGSDEQDFRLQHVADTRQHPLIQEHFLDGVGAVRRGCGGAPRCDRTPGSARSGPSAWTRVWRASSREVRNSATGTLNPTATYASVPRRARACRVPGAASARRVDRCASCRSSACACAGSDRRRTSSAGACRATSPTRWCGPRSGRSSSTRVSAG